MKLKLWVVCLLLVTSGPGMAAVVAQFEHTGRVSMYAVQLNDSNNPRVVFHAGSSAPYACLQGSGYGQFVMFFPNGLYSTSPTTIKGKKEILRMLQVSYLTGRNVTLSVDYRDDNVCEVTAVQYAM